jgi:hypothetical protein
MPVTDDLKVKGFNGRLNTAKAVTYVLESTGTSASMTVGAVTECGPAAGALSSKIPG